MNANNQELPAFLIGSLKISRSLIIGGWVLLLWTFGFPPLIGIALIMMVIVVLELEYST